MSGISAPAGEFACYPPSDLPTVHPGVAHWRAWWRNRFLPAMTSWRTCEISGVCRWTGVAEPDTVPPMVRYGPLGITTAHRPAMETPTRPATGYDHPDGTRTAATAAGAVTAAPCSIGR